MAVGLLRDIIDSCPKNARLLGLDIGERTIGVALSDSAHGIATPLQLIERAKFTIDIQVLNKIIVDFEIGGYVLGYPVNMDGTEGPRCQSVRHFGQEMENHPDIFGENPWIALWDERLSTVSVNKFLINDVDMSRTKRKQNVDKLAAQFILQGALDFIRTASF
ncbi:MAG: Holliday junction resolvase RuvX [Micavibrio aeruginosavorus]|uniref:Putative pre-16S rRNA nuclease n=1 Tax=Micavibrio aeruginosavorus TaxID=349221 RepID=A0A7T5UG73_9BACT|nr:MAG: Holliday junction resolvase RuvX [Micavibrio aeruginosavorus]